MASAVSPRQEVVRMPLWLIYTSFVLHKGEQFENELNDEKKHNNEERKRNYNTISNEFNEKNQNME